MTESTEQRVIADILKRQELGLRKYGMTVSANPLNLRGWLNHAFEEALDQAIYLKRAIEEIDSGSANKKWKQGDVHPVTGLIFWSKQKSCKNGERWMTKDQFSNKKKKISEISKRESTKEKNRLRRNTDKDRARRNAYAKIWNKSDERRAKAAAYARMKRRNDPIFSMSDRVRARLNEAIRNGGYKKSSKTTDILGCSWEVLKSHIESKFREGMSWENRSEWEIDHIVPIASAQSEDDVLRLNHYSNLQPLWRHENRKKSSKTDASCEVDIATQWRDEGFAKWRNER